MKRLPSSSAVLALLLLPACAPKGMRMPTGVDTTQSWPLTGYDEHPMREWDFRIADARVHDIEHSTPPAKMVRRSIGPNELTERTYSFDMDSRGHALHAECDDVAEPVSQPTIGFGKWKYKLTCSCREGDQPRALIDFAYKQGTVELSDGTRYALTSIQHADTGKLKTDILGYALTNATGTGAVERIDKGRAFPPLGVHEAVVPDLQCAYAALLLFRH